MFRLSERHALLIHSIFTIPFLITFPCLPNVGEASELDHEYREIVKVERPTEIEVPFVVQASYLRAWAGVYEDFLQVFDMKEDDLKISEYVVAFYEKGDEIIINAGRHPAASGSLGLERTVQYRIRKNDYKLVDKIFGK